MAKNQNYSRSLTEHDLTGTKFGEVGVGMDGPGEALQVPHKGHGTQEARLSETREVRIRLLGRLTVAVQKEHVPIQEARLSETRKVRIRLLEKLIMVMLMIRLSEGACTKCYQPIYNGENLQSLIRVHTHVDPTCLDIATLSTCLEDGKKYWIAKSTADFRQRLVGECPVREWVCFEELNHLNGVADLIKEKPVMLNKEEISEPLEKNLFIDLMEKISHELNLTNCWVCGNTQMADVWPWEGISLAPLDILRWRQLREELPEGKIRPKEQWDLKTTVIGEECIRRVGERYQTFVGKMPCKRYLTVREFTKEWVPTKPETYWAIRKRISCVYHSGYRLHEYSFWKAPRYLFWICGNRAYTHLPGNWSGSCTIGIIKPAFFLLPRNSGQQLGIPLYDTLEKSNRKKRTTIDMGGDQTWKGEIWTPEKIIKTYGPATWAQDGSWGYRTPIYMLNRIIRLQAVLEIISNKTALALDYISNQLTQTRAVVYQIRLAVDYLLANEGGICGKFNTSECCLEIDDKSEVIRNISKEIRKVAYVGNQEWKPIVSLDWWDSFWSFKGAWWKKVVFIIGTALASFLLLPCVIPCLIRTVTATVQTSLQNVDKPAQIMKLEAQEEGELETAEQIYSQFQSQREGELP
uniref:Envelope glycoprotein n=1 Tax=Cyanoderma ruficeps TaxID=181631 RepID=A0A8C3QGV4_9PASS